MSVASYLHASSRVLTLFLPLSLPFPLPSFLSLPHFRLLQRLEQTQRLCHRDDLLEAHFDDDSVVSVQSTVFWHVPDATEGEIRAAKEKAVQRFYCTVQRRNIKKKGKVVSSSVL